MESLLEQQHIPTGPFAIQHYRQINERTELAIALVMRGFHPSKKRDLLPGDNCGFLDSIDFRRVFQEWTVRSANRGV